MLKKALENKIIELANENDDLKRELFQEKMFVEIGDKKLVKAYERFDKKLEIINKIKDILK